MQQADAQRTGVVAIAAFAGLALACGGVPRCTDDLEAGDVVEISLVERWREGPYEWDAVNLWGQEGPSCVGVDTLAPGAILRVEVAEIAVAPTTATTVVRRWGS